MKIAPENAVEAIRLIWDLLQPGIYAPLLVPCISGKVQLEWHTKAGDIEVYIEVPDHVFFFVEHAESGESVEKPVAGNEEELRSWLWRICRVQ